MRKLFKCRKALSPVVAAIILIAVTVAVSIAVAAWMGALTFTFMKTEELKITGITWDTANPGTYGDLTMTNTGSSLLVITGAKVDDVTATKIYTSPSGATNGTALPATGYSLDKGLSLTVRVYKPSGTFTNDVKYTIVMLTKSGGQYQYPSTKT